MRLFDTGATRDDDTNKPDYEGYLSPLVIESFGAYMLKHQWQADGKKRDSDNWQKGFTFDVYMKSMWRHFMAVWKGHRGYSSREKKIEDLNALLFNVQGYLHEELKRGIEVPVQGSIRVGNEPSPTEVTPEVALRYSEST